MRYILTRAHEVVQALPLSDNQYVCLKCGLKGDLETLFGLQRCSPSIYPETSGFLDESVATK